MENKINIAELLKDCPKGMELYSPLCGKCVFDRLNMGTIICKKQNTQEITFTSEGYYMLPVFDDCECMIFPSKDQRDWSKFQRSERKDMSLADYQRRAMTTCMSSCENYSYMFLNLVGEVGELASKVSKAIRTGHANINENKLDFESINLKQEMMLEAGDVLWQLSGLCSAMGWPLEEIAQMNLDKLKSRQERGVIAGNGDHR